MKLFRIKMTLKVLRQKFYQEVKCYVRSIVFNFDGYKQPVPKKETDLIDFAKRYFVEELHYEDYDRTNELLGGYYMVQLFSSNWINIRDNCSHCQTHLTLYVKGKIKVWSILYRHKLFVYEGISYEKFKYIMDNCGIDFRRKEKEWCMFDYRTEKHMEFLRQKESA